MSTQNRVREAALKFFSRMVETFIHDDCLTWIEKVLMSSSGQETGTEQ